MFVFYWRYLWGWKGFPSLFNRIHPAFSSFPLLFPFGRDVIVFALRPGSALSETLINFSFLWVSFRWKFDLFLINSGLWEIVSMKNFQSQDFQIPLRYLSVSLKLHFVIIHPRNTKLDFILYSYIDTLKFRFEDYNNNNRNNNNNIIINNWNHCSWE